jgi:ABC-type nitrate/sulfonate/bicarbonate transport system permease component
MPDVKTPDARYAAPEAGPAGASPRRRLLGPINSMPAWAAAVTGVLVILVVWELVSLLFFHTISGQPGAVPPPFSVARQLASDLTDAVYWNAIGQTGLAALKGYAIGNLIAFFLAFLVLLVPWFDGLAVQLAVVCSCVPVTAVAPIVVLLSQTGSRSTSVFLAALSVIFTTVVGSLVGLRAASSTQLDVVRAYGGGRIAQLLKVRLIAALPSIMAALKIAAPAAFLGAVVGEYFLVGVDSGIGILLLAAQATASSVKLWAIGIICGAVAGLAYLLIGFVGRLLTPWSSGNSQKGKAF